MTNTNLFQPVADSSLFRFGDSNNDVAASDSIKLPENTDSVELSFDLLEIDSWDGESFFIVINGQYVDLGSFFVGQDEGATEFDAGNGISVQKAAAVDLAPIGKDGQYFDNDNSHTFTITIQNPGDTLDIGFGSTLDQAMGDESWAIDNLSLNAQINASQAGDVMHVFEAEDMTEIGFYDTDAQNASSGEISKTGKDSGWLSTEFEGAAGTFDLVLFLQDEDDGQSSIDVLVNGQSVGVVTLDRDSDGRGSDNGNFSEFVIPDVAVAAGDEIRFEVSRDGGEFVRFDKVELRAPETVTTQSIDLTKVQTLDFEGFARGDVISDQVDGVTISVVGGSNEAMVFDSYNWTGGDSDLATDTQGNILIISEDGDRADPDDNWQGGKFILEFDEPATMVDMVFVDTEEGGSIDLFDEFGDLIKSVNIPRLGDGETGTAGLNAEDVSHMVVNMNGSGAIDDVRFILADDPIEEPVPVDVVEAVDDAITVFETETSGDIDGDVLVNDIKNGEAYEGDVLGVSNDAANVGVQVVGTNGGLAVIYENGLIDFDANDEFDHLDAGDTDTTTFTYDIEAGETATVTVTVVGLDDPIEEEPYEPPVWMVF